MLPAGAIEARTLVDSMSWSSRPNTLVRLYQLPRSTALLAGGELSNDEGAELFEISERLRSTGPGSVRALIVPPESADPMLIVRMFKAGLQPVKRDDTPSLGPLKLLAILSFLGGVVLSFGDEWISPIGKALLFLAFWSTIGWIVRALRARRVVDPYWVAAARWADLVPSRRALVFQQADGTPAQGAPHSSSVPGSPRKNRWRLTLGLAIGLLLVALWAGVKFFLIYNSYYSSSLRVPGYQLILASKVLTVHGILALVCLLSGAVLLMVALGQRPDD